MSTKFKKYLLVLGIIILVDIIVSSILDGFLSYGLWDFLKTVIILGVVWLVVPTR